MTDARPPAKYKVGLVQMAMSADPDENLQHAIDRVEEAARQGARLVCLPELFRSRYFAQVEDAALFDLAEPVPGPSTEALGKVARRAGVVVIAPLFERRAPGLYHNTAAVIDADGRLVGLYRKMHIPDEPPYYLEFGGPPFPADRFGVVVMEAPRDREAVLVAEVALARIEEVRRSWPFLRDRRIDAYAGIGERFLDNAPPLIADS